MSEPKILTAGDLGTQVVPFTTNANSLVEQAERAVIDSQDTFDMSVDFIKICGQQVNSAEEMRTAIVKPLNDHVKWINDQFKPIKTRIEEARGIMQRKALTWKQAEDKRVRDEAEAERKRQEDLALEQAAEAEAAGDEKLAEAIVDVAVATPKPPVTRAPSGRGSLTGASGGISARWKGTVVDVKAVCTAIANGDLPNTVIKEFSKQQLNIIAKAHGKTEVKFGISIEEEQSLSVR